MRLTRSATGTRTPRPPNIDAIADGAAVLGAMRAPR